MGDDGLPERLVEPAMLHGGMHQAVFRHEIGHAGVFRDALDQVTEEPVLTAGQPDGGGGAGEDSFLTQMAVADDMDEHVLVG